MPREPDMTNANRTPLRDEIDRLRAVNADLVAALEAAQAALYKAGHHHGISAVMIAVDNALARARGEA